MSEIEDFFLNELKYENKRRNPKRMELLRHGSGHRKDEIWRKCNKNERAPKKYKINNLSELLFFYDDSLWRNAKCGILITSKALFVYPFAASLTDNPINYALWDMIGSYNCDLSGFFGNTMYLTFFDYGGNALFSSEHTVDEDEFQFVNSLLRKLFNYRQEKKKLEAEKKRKAEQEKKKLEAEAKRNAELQKKEEQLQLENNSYFYEIEINNRKVIKGPFSREDMISLLGKNEISLLTKVKFGLHKKTFKKLKSFPEFTSGFEDFL